MLPWGITVNEKEMRTWDGKVWNRNLFEVLRGISKMGYAGYDSSESDLTIYSSPVWRQKLRMVMEKNSLQLSSTWTTILPKKFPSGRRPKLNPKWTMNDPRQFRSLCISEVREEDLKDYFGYALHLANLLNDLGSNILTIGGPFILRKDIREKDYKLVAEMLDALADECSRFDLKLSYHPHLSTMIENSKDLDRLFDYADSKKIGICFDSAHLHVAGENLVDFLGKYGKRINHTHLKDLKDGRFLELGTGEIDFPKLVKTLESLGYSGWLIAELDLAKDSALASATRNKKYLDQLIIRETVDRRH